MFKDSKESMSRTQGIETLTPTHVFSMDDGLVKVLPTVPVVPFSIYVDGM